MAPIAHTPNLTDARLREAPGVGVFEAEGFALYTRAGFLYPQECDALISLIDVDRKPSGLLAHHPEPDYRTSESCDLDRFDPLVNRIDRRICTLLGLGEAHGETLQGQRYAVGQQFKAHHDWFARDAPYWDKVGGGGQRTWTAMIYLDEPAEGGETVFPAIGMSVTPRAAMLLAWNNLDADGQGDPRALHQSLPVRAGVKTIVTKWFRAHKWL